MIALVVKTASSPVLYIKEGDLSINTCHSYFPSGSETLGSALQTKTGDCSPSKVKIALFMQATHFNSNFYFENEWSLCA